ncbi:MAG: LPS export ABC transporter permease LptF [Legionellaceae bacterium]|nr:LPS export ABC transporter permease LptF [Legionellaceae bacterium]
MVLFRYLAREVFITLTGLTSILLFIFMSNQVVQYLNRAASGKIPGMLVLKLILLELPSLISLLLPLGFYVALLMTYTRLYDNSELLVCHTSGYTPRRLLKHSYCFSLCLFILISILMFWVSPFVYVERARILRSEGLKTFVQMLAPGRFQSLGSSGPVFYIETLKRRKQSAHQIFLARQMPKSERWQVLSAEKAKMQNTDLAIQQGTAYEGVPGQLDYRVLSFQQYRMRLPESTVALEKDIRTYPSARLLHGFLQTPLYAAELAWRFSIPFMLFPLTYIAVALSRVTPRSGQYARVFPAILIFVLYAQGLFMMRNWISTEKIPWYIGVCLLPTIFFIIGLYLMRRYQSK